MDYNDIEEENKMLKKKLENIKNWAKREILSQKEIINEDNLINKDKLINDKYCKIKSKN
jgi:predicted XRE-type DNA-binding protein